MKYVGRFSATLASLLQAEPCKVKNMLKKLNINVVDNQGVLV